MLTVQRIAAGNIVAVLAGRSLNAVLESAWRDHAELTPAERGAVQDLSYGGLRHLGRLRAVLAELVPKPVANRELEALLVTALYQLEHSAAAPYAIVDHAVECAAAIAGPRMKSFVNAVLRNFQRQRATLLERADATDAGRYSYPEWWISRVRAQYPDHASALLAAGNAHPPMTLRANVRRQSPEAYLERLRAAGLPARLLQHGALRLERPLPVAQLPGFSDGDVSVQDAGAQRTAGLLDLKGGMRVLDACAAPGGKSAHILESADVALTALDLDPERLRRVQANLDRLRLGAVVRGADAGALASWWDGVPFDRVLLDAPCSASGVVRRHPDIKWLRKPGDIARFARQQGRLLEALWKVVARGGKLLYVTCSVFREENQEAIDRFASRHGDARPRGGMPGNEGQLLPNDEHDGFYFALLQKD